MTVMKITREDIKHLAELSSLSLEDSEIDAQASDLENILTYISQLDQLDTTNVAPTYQVFEMENIWREDTVQQQDATPDQLLSISPAEKEHQIMVPKVL